MKRATIAALLLGLSLAGTAGLIAQTSTGIAGGGVTGGGGNPGGSAFSTQYKSGNQLAGTGPGTSGQILQSNGAGSAPTYQALSADEITAGTLAVARGGTNLTASADDNTMVGNGTTWQTKAIGSCSGATNALTYNTTTNAFGCNTISGGGTGTTGTFTLNWSDACTTTPTTTITYTLDDTNTVVTWWFPSMSVSSCTSDSTSFTSGADVPVALRPTTANVIVVGVRTQDNGAVDNAMGCIQITTTGIALVQRPTANGCQGGWTGSGSKSVNQSLGTSITYRLN